MSKPSPNHVRPEGPKGPFSLADLRDRATRLSPATRMTRVLRVELYALVEATDDLLGQVLMVEQAALVLRDLKENWRRIIEEEDPDGGPLIENLLDSVLQDLDTDEAREKLDEFTDGIYANGL